MRCCLPQLHLAGAPFCFIFDFLPILSFSFATGSFTNKSATPPTPTHLTLPYTVIYLRSTESSKVPYLTQYLEKYLAHCPSELSSLVASIGIPAKRHPARVPVPLPPCYNTTAEVDSISPPLRLTAFPANIRTKRLPSAPSSFHISPSYHRRQPPQRPF